MLTDALAAFADRPGLIAADRQLTWGQALALGRQLIAGLPRPRSLVMLRCRTDIESVSALLALLADGHVPLLVEADLAPALGAQLAERYRVEAIVDPATEVTLTGAVPAELNPALALLLTTSGSTGSPKLVRLSAAGLAANAAAIAASLDLSADERPLLHLPISYSYGLSVITSHLSVGAALVPTTAGIMEPAWWAALADHGATSISGVPFHYATLRRFGEARLDLPQLRTLTQAGGKLDAKIAAWFADFAARSGRRFVIMYGQTEAGPRIATLPPEHALAATDAIGRPIPGVSIRLVDEDGGDVAPGEAGEMLVRSPAVMLGYAHGPDDLAAGDTLGGELATGDVAVLGPDGLYRIVGRRSRLLKIFGLRINLDEIETRLAAIGHPALAFGDDDRLQLLLEAPGSDVAEVRARLTELFSLPPRGIEIRSAGTPVERGATGKISKAAFAAAWEAAA
ncbi:hypothetical protein IP88_08830 [alpha proteobacterium AAP81b]|nr:hypothetical protein IP88_08830 [alpha proteobacterium AAP81b]